MEVSLNNKEIITLLADYCRSDFEELENGYLIKVRRNIELIITEEELTIISQKLIKLNIDNETSLYDDSSYEIIVREESTGPVGRFREDKIEVDNEETGFTYELSPASDEYLVWILNEIKTKLSPRDFRFGMYFHGRRIDRSLDEKNQINPLEYIRITSLRMLTLKIKSEKRTSLAQFSKYTYSFLFHIGYNLDIALVPQRLLEEIARRNRITRMRRARADEIDPPRRLYTEDLVQHYLLAVSTDNPVIEYLSYYHILEHFFESVFNDDLLDSIKLTITDPGFSYKRKKDINRLVKSIKKSLQIKSETITFSESEALKLCIQKFVDLNDLKTKLTEYDESYPL